MGRILFSGGQSSTVRPIGLSRARLGARGSLVSISAVGRRPRHGRSRRPPPGLADMMYRVLPRFGIGLVFDVVLERRNVRNAEYGD